jgi:hypothetical protein
MCRTIARILTTLSLLLALVSPILLSHFTNNRGPSKVVVVESEVFFEDDHTGHQHSCECDCCRGR